MNKGWEVDEDQSFEHFLALTDNVTIKKIQQEPKKTSPQARMRFRTVSMPKVEEIIKKETTVQESQIQISKPQIRTPIMRQPRQQRLLDSRITIRSKLFQNPIEPTPKMGRAVPQKFFNPLLRNGDQQQKLAFSRKMRSMNNIFNDERIISQNQDFLYTKFPRSNVVYVALSK